MSKPNPKEIDETDLAALRPEADSTAIIVALLGVDEMRPDDRDRTKAEVSEYVQSGDVHEARALIQHARARRELWERESEIVEFPESETV